MSEPRTFASLTPTLLARKGGAKPAMRPQLQAMPHHSDIQADEVHDDLGWNDMGYDEAEAGPEPAEIVPIHHAPQPATIVPEVIHQQAELARAVSAPARTAAPARAPAPVRRSALDEGRRAAFTLRVDAERHLKLRLACTLRNRSAQQLMTEALDTLLGGLPEVGQLAAQVSTKRT